MESYRSHGSFGTLLFSVFFFVNWWISSSHSFGLKTYWSTSHNLVIVILWFTLKHWYSISSHLLSVGSWSLRRAIRVKCWAMLWRLPSNWLSWEMHKQLVLALYPPCQVLYCWRHLPHIPVHSHFKITSTFANPVLSVELMRGCKLSNITPKDPKRAQNFVVHLKILFPTFIFSFKGNNY